MSKQNYVITTDTAADLPESFLKAHCRDVHPLYVNIDGENHSGATLDVKEFYDQMRSGKPVSTNATMLEDIEKSFRAILEEGLDILHISFSSGLSCTYSNTVIVANQLREEYKERTIMVIDSLCASMGQGLFVYYACKLREEGKSITEVYEWLLENRLHVCHHFTVDDLHYLQRGGRISKSVAIVGSLIKVKPVLFVDNEGHLIPLTNVRGRKKALVALVDEMIKRMGSCKNEIIFISHGDDLESAEFVRDLVKERTGIDSFMINLISPVIGAHSGPGTIALFSLGEARQ